METCHVEFALFACVCPHAGHVVIGHIHVRRYQHRTVILPLQRQLTVVYPCNTQHTAAFPHVPDSIKHFLPFNLCSSFAENPLTALEPTQQPSTEDFFTGGDKAAGLWGHHSPPSTAEIQNKWRYAATTPLRCLKPCTGGTLLRLSVRISVLLPHQLMNDM